LAEPGPDGADVCARYANAGWLRCEKSRSRKDRFRGPGGRTVFYSRRNLRQSTSPWPPSLPPFFALATSIMLRTLSLAVAQAVGQFGKPAAATLSR